MIRIDLANQLQNSEKAAPVVEKSKVTTFTRVTGLSKVHLEKLGELPVRKYVGAAALAFVLFRMVDTYKQDELRGQDKILKKLNSDAKTLQDELSKVNTYEDIKKTLSEDEFVIKSKLETINKLVKDKGDIPRQLTTVAKALPSDVWLEEIKMTRTELTLSGSSMGLNLVSDFMKKVGESAYFTDVTLKNSKQQKNDSGKEIASFEMVLSRGK